MRIGHHDRPRSKFVRTGAAEREGGYVLVMFAMLLIPLMLLVGLSIDVGSWYNRSSEMQKAADAAALAGVVWLPDETTARNVALATAKKNGFDDADPDIDVTVVKSNTTTNRLRVTIRDRRVGSYVFSNLGGNDLDMKRTAHAEYVLPVRMGSPENKLGNDPTAPGYPTGAPNLWASISGPATAYNNGDPYSTKLGSEYRNWGYLYIIDVPQGAVGRSLNLSIYDAGHYQRPNYANVETADNGTVNTQFELFKPDSTPANPHDNIDPARNLTMVGGCSSGTPGRFRIAAEAQAGTYKNQWRSLCTFTPTAEGKWIMQVKSSSIPTITDGGNGWNQFSIRAVSSGAGVQPALYTFGDLSLFNNLPGRSGNINAAFYLAEITQIHAGKILEISLFDPGDGASGTYYANIRGPGNSVQPCQYRARGASTWTSSTNCRITTRSGGNNQYQGLWLDVRLTMPLTYTCSNCWWTVLYEFQNVSNGASPNDRTVWTAKVIGDPVHLIEE